mgnify:CR=1 FL=1
MLKKIQDIWLHSSKNVKLLIIALLSAGLFGSAAVKATEQSKIVENQYIPFETTYVDDESQDMGTNSTIEQGQLGEKNVTYVVSKVAGVQLSKKFEFEKVIKKPVPAKVNKGIIEVKPTHEDISIQYTTIEKADPSSPQGSRKTVQVEQQGEKNMAFAERLLRVIFLGKREKK